MCVCAWVAERVTLGRRTEGQRAREMSWPCSMSGNLSPCFARDSPAGAPWASLPLGGGITHPHHHLDLFAANLGVCVCALAQLCGIPASKATRPLFLGDALYLVRLCWTVLVARSSTKPWTKVPARNESGVQRCPERKRGGRKEGERQTERGFLRCAWHDSRPCRRRNW